VIVILDVGEAVADAVAAGVSDVGIGIVAAPEVVVLEPPAHAVIAAATPMIAAA
jgi:hypothetical protein